MRLVVLGDPVGHSLSPTIQQAALEAVGIPGSYEARRVDAAGMAAAIEELQRGVIDGANVTMPHKALAADLADRLEPVAQRAGAVNTLLRVDRAIVGHNTDIVGVRTAWSWAALPATGPVLVLGAGGAAGAALLAMQDRPRFIAARRPEAAAALLASLGLDAEIVKWGTAVPNAVVVNATPLGMGGETLPTTTLDDAVGLLEMAYGSGLTPAAHTMAVAGKPFATGPDMLLAQGAASFELWTGRLAPVAQMRAAMEQELAKRHRP